MKSPAGLNRTSVGLKRWVAVSPGVVGLSPQSNQRGIETKPKRSLGDFAQGLPQSNQRGIETKMREGGIRHRGRLNRTSVGLKPGGGRSSTPRGSSLNRTSVGLKPAWTAGKEPPAWKASIEPAWD